MFSSLQLVLRLQKQVTPRKVTAIKMRPSPAKAPVHRHEFPKTAYVQIAAFLLPVLPLPDDQAHHQSKAAWHSAAFHVFFAGFLKGKRYF